MNIGQVGSNTTAGSALDKAVLHKKGLIDFLERVAVFTQSGSQSLDAHRSAVITIDQNFKQAPVGGVQPGCINLICFQSLAGNRDINRLLASKLPIVPDQANKPIGDTRG